MKKRLLIIAIASIIPAFLLLRFVNREYFILWNTNEVNVTTGTPLSAEKVKIEFGVSVNTINRANDTDLFRNRVKYILIFDGENRAKIPNEYGENDFLITYNNKYYFSFRQFRMNERQQQNYSFHFSRKEKGIVLHVTIEGEKIMDFERQMIPISSASKYRCNIPLEKAGTVYNMTELIENKNPTP